MTEKHTVNERAALYGNHLAIIVKLSVKRLRIQWKPRHQHRHVCHAIRIDNETCNGSDTINKFQTVPYLRVHLATLEHGKSVWAAADPTSCSLLLHLDMTHTLVESDRRSTVQ